MAKAKTFLRLHLKENYTSFLGAFAMHEMLFTKDEISSSIHFWNLGHNNGRRKKHCPKESSES